MLRMYFVEEAILKKSIFLRNNFQNAFLVAAILKMYFMREHFWKYIFRGGNIQNVFLKMYILREQF